MDLSNKTIIVTGASSGIGEQLSKKLARKKANVVCAARRENELQRVIDHIHSQGGSAVSVPTDITNVEQCQILVKKTIDQFGQLDILVLNAGISMWAPFEEMEDVSFFRQLMETNYMGAVHCCHAALDHLRSSNGLIVSCSTAQALMGFPNHTGYSASKCALNGFLESLEMEMKGDIHFLYAILGWIQGTNLRSNAYGADGQKLGSTKRKHTKQSVLLEDCVNAIVSSMEKNKRTMYIPWKLRLIPFMKIFFKKYLRHRVTKAMDEHTD